MRVSGARSVRRPPGLTSRLAPVAGLPWPASDKCRSSVYITHWPAPDKTHTIDLPCQRSAISSGATRKQRQKQRREQQPMSSSAEPPATTVGPSPQERSLRHKRPTPPARSFRRPRSAHAPGRHRPPADNSEPQPHIASAELLAGPVRPPRSGRHRPARLGVTAAIRRLLVRLRRVTKRRRSARRRSAHRQSGHHQPTPGHAHTTGDLTTWAIPALHRIDPGSTRAARVELYSSYFSNRFSYAGSQGDMR